MLDKKIGYILCETASSEPAKPVILEEANGRVTIETVLQDMDIKNRNGRYYSEKEMGPALQDKRLQELISTGNLLGECNHPMTSELSRQQVVDIGNSSHKILKLWTEGKDIKGLVKGTPNDRGNEFNNFIIDGTKVSFSLRALGTVNRTSRGAEVENIKIITYDWVIYPSHQRAYMQNIVNESAGIIENTPEGYSRTSSGLFVPINNKQVTDYIKQESTNLKYVIESFEMLYESMDVVDGGSKVKIVDKEGTIIMVNLESYVQNEIMNYCLG